MTIHHMLYGSAALYALCLLLFTVKKRRWSFIALCAGFLLHTIYQVSRAWIGGIFIPNGMFDGIFLTPWALALGIIILKLRSDEDMPWESASLLVCFFTVLAIIYPKGLIPPTPNKLTVWAHLFFITEVTGQACFYLGAWFAFLSIVRKRESSVFHSLIVWGFVLYSIAQVTGAVWAYLGWATTFRWGARHMQSAVMWCYFAAYLHMRFMPKWGHREKAWYATAGFFVVLACTLGSYFNEMKFPRIGG